MKLSRREVYELVWSAPMTAIGRLLGISSVSLAKTCARRGIPTPPRGYWQKVAAGIDLPPRPPLGEVDVELQMPWDRTPIVENAVARAIALSGSAVLGPSVNAATALAIKLEGAHKDESSEQALPLSQASAALFDRKSSRREQRPLPEDLDAAIDLARRIEDLRALNSLTEMALAAGTSLPANEEDRLRTWVAGIRAQMRHIDPLRQLVDSARSISGSGAGKGGGET